MTGTQRGKEQTPSVSSQLYLTSYKGTGWQCHLRRPEGSPGSEPNPRDHDELSRGTSLPLHLEGEIFQQY